MTDIPTRTRNPDATRRRILTAALREFSAKGITGARVDVIAAKAKANKRMLYYYFGSKDGLFRAVLRQRLADRAPSQDGADRVAPDRLVRIQRQLLESRDYVRLLMWEALERGNRPVENEAVRAENLKRWIGEVRVAQEGGQLPSDIDAEQIVLSELATAMFPIAFPQLTRMITGLSPSDPAFV